MQTAKRIALKKKDIARDAPLDALKTVEALADDIERHLDRAEREKTLNPLCVRIRLEQIRRAAQDAIRDAGQSTPHDEPA